MTNLCVVDGETMDSNDTVQAEARRLLLDAIDVSGLSKAEVARRAGRSRPQVNTVLASSSSMNLRTLAHFLHAAGYQLKLQAVPLDGIGPTLD